MNNILLESYLTHLQKAYEAEKVEDYVARKYHMDMASKVILVSSQDLSIK